MRFLNLHEYQSKDLMESFGVVVQRGRMAATAADAGAAAREVLAANAGAELVLKAQIHAGGRGKGVFDNGYKGGVKLCATAAEVSAAAERMLGARLVTKQTGPTGQLVTKVLVNEGIAIHRELYFAILMDRAHGGPVLVASTQGGMDIEEVAEKHPGAIITEPVDIMAGLGEPQARALAARLGLTGDLADKAARQFVALYKLFIATDATQVEINPLAEGSVPGRSDKTRSIFAVDAKLNFDDNAAFRQGKVYAQRDRSMEDPRDVAAEEVRRVEGRRRRLGNAGRSALLPLCSGAAIILPLCPPPPPPRPGSTTSASTAASAAWSTAPAWPWRRWTLSSCTAARPPTFSTSAAVPRRRRSRRPSRF